MLKGWWAGKTKARLAAKASGAIGRLSKEIGREAMLPAAVEAWNSYYSYQYWYSYYRYSGTIRIVPVLVVQ